MWFLFEIFEIVCVVFLEDWLVGVCVFVIDWVEGGWEFDDMIVFVYELKCCGCDWIDVLFGGVLLL